MDFNLTFFIILFLYILILITYFIFSRHLNAKFANERIRLPQDRKFKFPNNRKRIIKTDILDSMFFLMSSLNEDSRKNNNSVFLDYSMSYPRTFNADASTIIKLTDALAQIMLLNLSNATIIIKFLLSNYSKNKVKFTISVWANDNFCKDPIYKNMIHAAMTPDSRYFFRLAQKIAADNGSDVRFDHEAQGFLKISADVTLELANAKTDILQGLRIKNAKNFTALIAEDNLYSFGILKKELEFIGIDVKPTSDLEIIKRHIQDAIFKPDIVFIKSSIIENIDMTEIEKSLINKNISLVIIQSDDNNLKNSSELYIQYLPQPYTPDILINILNNAYSYHKWGVVKA